MADSLYVLAMVMTQPVTKFLSEEEFDSLQKAAVFIASIHAKSFLQSPKIELAPLNDFNQMKRLQKLIDCEISGAQSYFDSQRNHSYYIQPELIVISLFSDETSIEEKEQISQKLLTFKIPDEFEKFCYSQKDLNLSTENINKKV